MSKQTNGHWEKSNRGFSFDNLYSEKNSSNGNFLTANWSKLVTKLKTSTSSNQLHESTAQLTELDSESKGGTKFGSAFGIIVSCLGCVVGTGNIWRFPRICAASSSPEGSLMFLIVWISFLQLWSTPICLIEYTIGRFSKCSPFLACTKFLGPKFVWTGSWIVIITSMVGCFYNVVVGWTMYYFVMMCALTELPSDELTSQEIFDTFTTKTYWPLLTHTISLLIVGSCILGGLKWIERANMILVPLLVFIILFTFSWSLTRPYNDVGIKFLFTPSLSDLKDPLIWINALTQNAFDTGAGLGTFAAYASYFTRTDGAVRYAISIPIVNNLVSMICGITVFGTVYSTLILDNPCLSKHSILTLMKTSGPGGTGLTFTWIPVLFSKVGTMGRVLCPLFFLCLAFAGITSQISNTQLFSLAIKDLGMEHNRSVLLALAITFLLGAPSAIWIDFLANQDNAWSYALMISGGCFALVCIVYGVERYRRVVINEFGIGDWKLYKPWSALVLIMVPLQMVVLISWWIYDSIKNDPKWYIPTYTSLSTILLEWLFLILLLLAFTVYCCKKQPQFLDNAISVGYDPYNPDYPSTEKLLEKNHEIEVEIGETHFYSVKNPENQYFRTNF